MQFMQLELLRVLTELEQQLLSCSVSSLCHLWGFLLSQLQAFGFVLVEFYHIFVTPFLQPVWVTLDHTCAHTWSCPYSVSYRVGDSAAFLSSIKPLNRTGPTIDPCVTWVVTVLWVAHHQFMSPVFTCLAIQTITVELGYKNAVYLKFWSIHHCSK